MAAQAAMKLEVKNVLIRRSPVVAGVTLLLLALTVSSLPIISPRSQSATNVMINFTAAAATSTNDESTKIASPPLQFLSEEVEYEPHPEYYSEYEYESKEELPEEDLVQNTDNQLQKYRYKRGIEATTDSLAYLARFTEKPTVNQWVNHHGRTEHPMGASFFDGGEEETELPFDTGGYKYTTVESASVSDDHIVTLPPPLIGNRSSSSIPKGSSKKKATATKSGEKKQPGSIAEVKKGSVNNNTKINSHPISPLSKNSSQLPPPTLPHKPKFVPGSWQEVIYNLIHTRYGQGHHVIANTNNDQEEKKLGVLERTSKFTAIRHQLREKWEVAKEEAKAKGFQLEFFIKHLRKDKEIQNLLKDWMESDVDMLWIWTFQNVTENFPEFEAFYRETVKELYKSRMMGAGGGHQNLHNNVTNLDHILKSIIMPPKVPHSLVDSAEETLETTTKKSSDDDDSFLNSGENPIQKKVLDPVSKTVLQSNSINGNNENPLEKLTKNIKKGPPMMGRSFGGSPDDDDNDDNKEILRTFTKSKAANPKNSKHGDGIKKRNKNTLPSPNKKLLDLLKNKPDVSNNNASKNGDDNDDDEILTSTEKAVPVTTGEFISTAYAPSLAITTEKSSDSDTKADNLTTNAPNKENATSDSDITSLGNYTTENALLPTTETSIKNPNIIITTESSSSSSSQTVDGLITSTTQISRLGGERTTEAALKEQITTESFLEAFTQSQVNPEKMETTQLNLINPTTDSTLSTNLNQTDDAIKSPLITTESSLSLQTTTAQSNPAGTEAKTTTQAQPNNQFITTESTLSATSINEDKSQSQATTESLTIDAGGKAITQTNRAETEASLQINATTESSVPKGETEAAKPTQVTTESSNTEGGAGRTAFSSQTTPAAAPESKSSTDSTTLSNAEPKDPQMTTMSPLNADGTSKTNQTRTEATKSNNSNDATTEASIPKNQLDQSQQITTESSSSLIKDESSSAKPKTSGVATTEDTQTNIPKTGPIIPSVEVTSTSTSPSNVIDNKKGKAKSDNASSPGKRDSSKGGDGLPNKTSQLKNSTKDASKIKNGSLTEQKGGGKKIPALSLTKSPVSSNATTDASNNTSGDATPIAENKSNSSNPLSNNTSGDTPSLVGESVSSSTASPVATNKNNTNNDLLANNNASGGDTLSLGENDNKTRADFDDKKKSVNETTNSVPKTNSNNDGANKTIGEKPTIETVSVGEPNTLEKKGNATKSVGTPSSSNNGTDEVVKTPSENGNDVVNKSSVDTPAVGGENNLPGGSPDEKSEAGQKDGDGKLNNQSPGNQQKSKDESKKKKDKKESRKPEDEKVSPKQKKDPKIKPESAAQKDKKDGGGKGNGTEPNGKNKAAETKGNEPITNASSKNNDNNNTTSNNGDLTSVGDNVSNLNNNSVTSLPSNNDGVTNTSGIVLPNRKNDSTETSPVEEKKIDGISAIDNQTSPNNDQVNNTNGVDSQTTATPIGENNLTNGSAGPGVKTEAEQQPEPNSIKTGEGNPKKQNPQSPEPNKGGGGKKGKESAKNGKSGNNTSGAGDSDPIDESGRTKKKNKHPQIKPGNVSPLQKRPGKGGPEKGMGKPVSSLAGESALPNKDNGTINTDELAPVGSFPSTNDSNNISNTDTPAVGKSNANQTALDDGEKKVNESNSTSTATPTSNNDTNAVVPDIDRANGGTNNTNGNTTMALGESNSTRINPEEKSEAEQLNGKLKQQDPGSLNSNKDGGKKGKEGKANGKNNKPGDKDKAGGKGGNGNKEKASDKKKRLSNNTNTITGNNGTSVGDIPSVANTNATSGNGENSTAGEIDSNKPTLNAAKNGNDDTDLVTNPDSSSINDKGSNNSNISNFDGGNETSVTTQPSSNITNGDVAPTAENDFNRTGSPDEKNADDPNSVIANPLSNTSNTSVVNPLSNTENNLTKMDSGSVEKSGFDAGNGKQKNKQTPGSPHSNKDGSKKGKNSKDSKTGKPGESSGGGGSLPDGDDGNGDTSLQSKKPHGKGKKENGSSPAAAGGKEKQKGQGKKGSNKESNLNTTIIPHFRNDNEGNKPAYGNESSPSFSNDTAAEINNNTSNAEKVNTDLPAIADETGSVPVNKTKDGETEKVNSVDRKLLTGKNGSEKAEKIGRDGGSESDSSGSSPSLTKVEGDKGGQNRSSDESGSGNKEGVESTDQRNTGEHLPSNKSVTDADSFANGTNVTSSSSDGVESAKENEKDFSGKNKTGVNDPAGEEGAEFSGSGGPIGKSQKLGGGSFPDEEKGSSNSSLSPTLGEEISSQNGTSSNGKDFTKAAKLPFGRSMEGAPEKDDQSKKSGKGKGKSDAGKGKSDAGKGKGGKGQNASDKKKGTPGGRSFDGSPDESKKGGKLKTEKGGGGSPLNKNSTLATAAANKSNESSPSDNTTAESQKSGTDGTGTPQQEKGNSDLKDTLKGISSPLNSNQQANDNPSINELAKDLSPSALLSSSKNNSNSPDVCPNNNCPCSTKEEKEKAMEDLRRIVKNGVKKNSANESKEMTFQFTKEDLQSIISIVASKTGNVEVEELLKENGEREKQEVQKLTEKLAENVVPKRGNEISKALRLKRSLNFPPSTSKQAVKLKKRKQLGIVERKHENRSQFSSFNSPRKTKPNQIKKSFRKNHAKQKKNIVSHSKPIHNEDVKSNKGSMSSNSSIVLVEERLLSDNIVVKRV